MARRPLPTSFFVLVIVRKAERFLMVQERRYQRAWSLPGGRVEPGEPLPRAALREVQEETGLKVELQGVVRLEHVPSVTNTRVRIIFLANLVGDDTPKSIADEESLGAAWLTLAELEHLRLRGDDLLGFLRAFAAEPVVMPLSLLGSELSI